MLKSRTAEEDEEVLDELPLFLTGHCKADLSLHAITHANRLLQWKREAFVYLLFLLVKMQK